MELVGFKNSLADHVTVNTTVQDIIAKVQTIPNHPTLKMDLELTLYICKVVENIVSPKVKTSTIDKSNIVVQVFQGIFPDMTDTDIEYIKKQIQYFWSNKMITRKKFIVKYGIYAYNLLKKKLT
jgi:hypothetical protein